MDTSGLKSFAQEARTKLRQQIGTRLDYWLGSDSAEHRQFAAQIKELKAALAKEGRDALIERVAYTWFNRLAALRFLDANGYHPFGVRVVTPASEGEVMPEVLQQARAGVLDAGLRKELSNSETFDRLIDGRMQIENAQGEAYRMLLFAVCHYYHRLMPFLFERLGDATELLLPEDLLTEHSIVSDFREALEDDDCREVEVIGWLYQFYISEKKDEVMARKTAVKKEDIPAVTQLFTPHWIVRYLVENSLGRLWLQSRPRSRLRDHMPYYIEDPAPEPPAWELDWKEKGISCSEGNFEKFMWLRPNPKAEGRLEDAGWYALTIDGYAYAKSAWGLDALSGEASAKLEEIEANGWAKASFPDLRGCLFVLQRQHKWSDGSYTGDIEARFKVCHETLCSAWDREWRKHEKELPDLSAYGIPLPESPTPALTIEKPEEIRLLDPASGSGHMLTYAFDLLYVIYEEEGYDAAGIPGLILKYNLYGLEICERAAALSAFALCMKARSRDKRFFKRIEDASKDVSRPHIIELRDIHFEDNELRDYIRELKLGDLFNEPVLKLLHQFGESKNFGSLIQPCLDQKAIAFTRSVIEEKDLAGQLFLRNTHEKVLQALDQAEALTERYHVVTANPPYMGSKAMNPDLKKFVKNQFKLGDVDIYTSFIERSFNLLTSSGHLGFITMHSWMFLSKYDKFRSKLLSDRKISSLVHLGSGAFSSIGGAVVQTVAFSAIKTLLVNNRPVCFRLLRGDEQQKHHAFLARQEMYEEFTQNEFLMLPGSPVAYWCSRKAFQVFSTANLLDSITYLQPGLQTCENARFLRFWQEVSVAKASFGGLSQAEASASGKKWFGYTKGGEFRRWYGNLDLVVNWANNGYEIKKTANDKYPYLHGNTDYVIKDRGYYFKSGVTWTVASGNTLGVRFLPHGLIFDCKASACFPPEETKFWLLAFLASLAAQYFLDLQNPGIDVQAGNIASLPLVSDHVMDANIRKIQSDIATEAVNLARTDWDNCETSWDFRELPFLRSEIKDPNLEASWQNWEAQRSAAVRRMQELETENNRLFILAYGLEGELAPEVHEDQITLTRADRYKDAAALLSYTVGCMMGRYSLDQHGFILADAGATLQDYLVKVPTPTFRPNADAILPVLDGEWFPDDVAARNREFLKVVWGEKHLVQNLAWLEAALGKDLRSYFVRDFYKNHLSKERAYGYKKRPIYWLVSSPEGSFQALIYLHRYNRDTINLLLDQYVREFVHKLEARAKLLTSTTIDESARTSERTTSTRERDKIQKMIREIQAWDRDVVLPLAQQRIELDLDDGVKTNYLKFPGLLAKIPGLEKKEED
jgi:hypothetical protein